MDERAAEESLDPADWEAFARTAHALLDDLIAYQRGLAQRPAWQAMSDATVSGLAAPLPVDPAPLERVAADLQRLVLPHALGNPHPRFWGWVTGNGTPDAVLADAVAAAMNANLGGADHAANVVEAVVLGWLKEMLGYPADASGVFVSGGSHANLTGIAVARHAKAGHDVRAEGLAGRPPLIAYGTAEMHSSNDRAIEVLGIGSRNLRKIATRDDLTMDPGALRAAIREDRTRGLRPFVVIATAGTTSTGAIDPLDAIADVAAEEGLWMHVDGAFGALAALAPRERHLVRGIERADSLAFDLHKWGWLPIACGVALVKDPQQHLAAFTMHPPYLAHETRGPGAARGDVPWATDLGIESSRPFRALKAYVALRTHGAAKWGRIVQQNVDHARRLAALVEAAPDLELLAPRSLNIVCFRARPAGVPQDALDALNAEIVLRIQESGFAVPSATRVRDRYAIRCNFTNHRTTFADVEAFVDAVRAAADVLRRERARR